MSNPAIAAPKSTRELGSGTAAVVAAKVELALMGPLEVVRSYVLKAELPIVSSMSFSVESLIPAAKEV